MNCKIFNPHDTTYIQVVESGGEVIQHQPKSPIIFVVPNSGQKPQVHWSLNILAFVTLKVLFPFGESLALFRC